MKESEPGSIPLRNWSFLLIPSPVPELKWLGIEFELSSFEFELESELHLTELDSELPSMELKSDMRSLIYLWPTTVLATQRRLTQVVYTLHVQIDSTKKIRDSFLIVHTHL